MATPGGERNKRLRFERRDLDGNGDRLGAWRTIITLSAKVTYLRGTEVVIAQRLQGIQPAALNVRACHALREVDNSWRAVDKQTGEVFGLISAAPARGAPGELDVLGQIGATDG